jgi:hypothetical protein
MVPKMVLATPNPRSMDLARQAPFFSKKSGVRIFPGFG